MLDAAKIPVCSVVNTDVGDLSACRDTALRHVTVYDAVVRRNQGRNDIAHNRDHYKKRNFKKDEDKKDYETGYQAGHRGKTPDHNQQNGSETKSGNKHLISADRAALSLF